MENPYANINEEHNALMRILNFRFHHSFKKIGLIGAVLIFTFLLGSKFMGMNSALVKDVSRTVMLLFLLVASLSKDELEDEYIIHVRSQSFVIAFVCALAYAVGVPLIALVFDILITNITGDGAIGFHEVSSFEVMFILVCFQILFFETLKRFGRAQ